MTAPGNLSSDRRVRADREATDWLILQQDDPGNAEIRARFESWLSASTENAEAWAETAHVTAVIAATQPAHRTYWSDLPGTRAFAKPPYRAARRLIIAVISAAACFAILATPNLLLFNADHITGKGELRVVQLQDGSTVSLGADSAIDVVYSKGERRVRLLKGKAYFEVKRDTAHPFRVAARDVEANVLGTGFEMGLDGEGAGVAVRHGLVQVDYPKGAVSERLAAGEQISLRWNGGSEKSQSRPDRIASWTGKKLVVSNRPVREVIASLRPWYTGLILTTGDLDTARVTGVYDLADPVGALQALGQAHNASVHRLSPWVVVISAN